MRKTGLSVIELVTVMFIISLLVAAATPSANRLYQENRLSKKAESVVAFFRQARQNAVSEQTTYGVKVYLTNNRFQLIHIIPDEENPGQEIEEIVSELEIEEPLEILSGELNDGDLVFFNNIGNPNQAAGITIQDRFNRIRNICVNAVGSIQLKINESC